MVEMRTKQLHLVERAAERLRLGGLLDPAAQDPVTPRVAAVRPVAASDPALSPAAAPLALPASPVVGLAADPPQFVPRPRHVIDMPALRRAGIVAYGRSRSQTTDEFRIITTQVLRAAFDGDIATPGKTNVVMVTSTRPGEGKSFTAANLAANVALSSEHPALLVDVDPKPGSIGELLGLTEMNGLMDLAERPDLDCEHLALASAVDHLTVLPAGRDASRRGGLLAMRHVARLIGDIGRRDPHRLVILDAPPCLSTSDASTLAPLVGQIIFVVEYQRTARPEVEAALDLIQACPNIALLLNKVEPDSHNGFGAYASTYHP